MKKNASARQILIGILLMGVLLAVNAQSVLPTRADWHSLTGTLPAYTGALDYDISPDSNYVVYKADVDTDDTTELYSVPISGTTPVKLNPPLVLDGDVDRFAITPDSQFVFYIADQEVENRQELYRIPITGGIAVKMNADLVVGGNIRSFRIDPENNYVVYEGDQETNEVFELWSVPIIGGPPVKLNPTFPPGGDIALYNIDPLSNRVVYNADQEFDDVIELFSVPLAGGTSVKLNPPLAANRDSYFFLINPVIPVVVFTAQEVGTTKDDLWMMPTAGGVPPTQLNFNLLPEQFILNYRISPAGDRVVYSVRVTGTGTPPTTQMGNLYSVLIGGGGSVNLTETADPYYGVNMFEIMPDGNSVVYGYQADADAIPRLEAATVQFGVRSMLYQPSPSDSPFFYFRFSPDSQWVIYQTGDGAYGDLYTVPPGGGSSTRHGIGRIGTSTPDSSRLLYTSENGSQSVVDLFSAQIFGGGVRNLSGFEGTGFVGDIEVSADGNRIVFLTSSNGQYDLRVSDGTSAQPPTSPTPTATLTPTVTFTPTATPTTPPQPLLNLYLPLTQRQ